MCSLENLAPVLLVEDNDDDVELTLLALSESKLANPVIVVRDGAEALDFLFARGNYSHRDPKVLPQVILLDLNLPKLGGHEVLRQMRSDERTKTVPVVVLTTSKEDEDVLKSYNLGANSYVRKPVEFERFTTAVKNLSVYWVLLNESSHAEI